MRPEPEYAEGRFLFIADVLLHEMVHQYQIEVSGDLEKSQHGHGPHFRDVCNRIGQTLRLPPARSHKKRGPDKDSPSCAQWPHNVRPADYYQGAHVPPTAEPPTIPGAPKPCEVCQAMSPMIDEALVQLRKLVLMQKTAPFQACEQALTAIRAMVPIVGDDKEVE